MGTRVTDVGFSTHNYIYDLPIYVIILFPLWNSGIIQYVTIRVPVFNCVALLHLVCCRTCNVERVSQ